MDGCFRVSAKAGGTAGRGGGADRRLRVESRQTALGSKITRGVVCQACQLQASTASSCSVPRAQYNLKCKGSTLPVW